jgi:hypothetical protein
MDVQIFCHKIVIFFNTTITSIMYKEGSDIMSQRKMNNHMGLFSKQFVCIIDNYWHWFLEIRESLYQQLNLYAVNNCKIQYSFFAIR